MGKTELNFDIETQNFKIELENKRNYNKLNEMLNGSIYKSGIINKEVFKLPMPSSNEILKDKKLDLRVYGLLMLESNWGGEILNKYDRYMYKEKFDNSIIKICKEISVSERKVKTDINKLKKCNVDNDIKAIQISTTNNRDIIYKLNYGVHTECKDEIKFEKFVTITNVALRILINFTNDRVLRIYLFLLYKCYKEEKCITQEEICDKIGLSYNSRRLVGDALDGLYKLGFIDIRNCSKSIILENKQGFEYEQLIPKLYYSLSENYLNPKFNVHKK